jgi:hypothetical protein
MSKIQLKEATENYYAQSDRLSTVGRQLGFAGIALIWLFGLREDPDAAIPDDLTWPALLIVVSLGADFLQYTFGSAMWGGFRWWTEHHQEHEPEDYVNAPGWLNWAQNSLFAIKAVALVAAYVSLGVALSARVL